jgi:hypothetical protein
MRFGRNSLVGCSYIVILGDSPRVDAGAPKFYAWMLLLVIENQQEK